jgi:dTDP-4-dehydrorhamnose reductase
MKILVTGSEGMLGRALLARLADKHQAAGVDLPDGDLTLPAVAGALLQRHRPDWVVHCAAWTVPSRRAKRPWPPTRARRATWPRPVPPAAPD